MNEDVYTGCVENMRLPGSNLLFGGGSSSTLSLVITHSLACYSRPLARLFPALDFFQRVALSLSEQVCVYTPHAAGAYTVQILVVVVVVVRGAFETVSTDESRAAGGGGGGGGGGGEG